MHRSIARIWTLWLLLLAALLSEAPTWADNRAPELTARTVRGKGTWKTAGVGRRQLQHWSVDVQRRDSGELTGTVTVNDSPLLASGTVRGKIVGDRVSGTITTADAGETVRFWGIAKGRKLRGIYTDRTGTIGEWAWEGLLPE